MADSSAALSAAAARRLESIRWPDALRAALERLREGGHEAVLVGGSVRDALLGRTPHDVFDVATDLAPAEVLKRFERTEPLGIAHGTVLLLLGDVRIECTTFRREGSYPDARHPEHVEFTSDRTADLARRDLTINAIAWDPAARELTDPHGGVQDLAGRVLRAVGDPRARFFEDALRPLRVARFAATLEFTPEPATRAALGSALDRSARVALERVRAELERMMQAREPSRGFELLREAGLLELWLPEFARCVGVPQNRFHAHDVYGHSLRTCDAAPADKPVVRWAALLHDIGKPETRDDSKGDATFYGHAELGASLADALLSRLRFANAFRERVVLLVREHMFDYRAEWSDAALRRWLRRVTVDAVADLFDLRIADVIGNERRTGMPAGLEDMRRRIEDLLAADAVLRVSDLAVSGRDVMNVLGIGPGPRVGAILNALLEAVIEAPERNDREQLLNMVRSSGETGPANARDA
jgi:tRNA nucleotidyltransferase (CCA-adding enzyme)